MYMYVCIINTYLYINKWAHFLCSYITHTHLPSVYWISHLSTFKYWGSTGSHSWPVAFVFPTLRAASHSVLRDDEPNFPSPDSSLISGAPAFSSKLHLVLCLQNICIYSEIYICKGSPSPIIYFLNIYKIIFCFPHLLNSWPYHFHLGYWIGSSSVWDLIHFFPHATAWNCKIKEGK